MVELEITASDEWQEMVIVPERLTANNMQLKDWWSVGKIHFQTEIRLGPDAGDLRRLQVGAWHDQMK